MRRLIGLINVYEIFKENLRKFKTNAKEYEGICENDQLMCKWDGVKRHLIRMKVNYLLLFLVSWMILFVRYIEPFVCPEYYAEDGEWTGYLLGKNMLEVSFFSGAFPILGNTVLLMPGIIMLKMGLVSLHVIPLINAVVANSVLSLLAVSLIYFLKDYSKTLSYTVWLSFLLIPVGYDAGEIFGRALNVHFFYPAWLTIAFLWLLKQESYDYKAMLVELMAILTALSMPVGFGIIVLYLAVRKFYIKESIGKIVVEHRLLMSTLVLGVFFIDSMLASTGGTKGLSINWDNMVEFVFARTFLFAMISSIYSHFNNILSILLFWVLMFWVVRNIMVDEKYRFDIIWVGTCAMTYVIAFLLKRSALSVYLNDYMITFPDRYFTGINLCVLFVFLISLERFNRGNAQIIVSALLVINFLFSPGEFVISERPITSHNHGLLIERIENANLKNKSEIEIPPFGGWKMEVPSKYFK